MKKNCTQRRDEDGERPDGHRLEEHHVHEELRHLRFYDTVAICTRRTTTRLVKRCGRQRMDPKDSRRPYVSHHRADRR